MKADKLKNNGSLWAIALLALKTAIAFFLVPFVKDKMGIGAYGYVALANNVIAYIDLITIAFNYFSHRYVGIAYHRGDNEKATAYYSSVIFVNVLLMIISSVPIFLFIYRFERFIKVSDLLLADVRLLFLFVIFKYFISLLSSANEVGAFAAERIDITYKNKIISNLIYIGIAIWLYSSDNSHIYFLGIATLASEVINLFLQYSAKRRLIPVIRFSSKGISLNKIKELFFQGIWVSINNLGNILNNGLDLLICNLMLTETIMGMVSVAKLVSTTGYSLVIAVSDSIKPKLLKLYSDENIDAFVSELKYSMKITGGLFLIVLSVLISCGESALNVWLKYENSSIIYKLLVISVLADIAPGVVRPLYYTYTLKKRMKVPCLITILMGIMNVVSMYVLLKMTSLGGYAVVLTTMIINLVHFIDAPLYSSYCLKLKKRTFYPVILRYLVVLTVVGVWAVAARMFLPQSNSIIVILLELIGVAAVTVLLIFGGFFTRDERKRLIDIK